MYFQAKCAAGESEPAGREQRLLHAGRRLKIVAHPLIGRVQLLVERFQRLVPLGQLLLGEGQLFVQAVQLAVLFDRVFERRDQQIQHLLAPRLDAIGLAGQSDGQFAFPLPASPSLTGDLSNDSTRARR